MRKGIINKMVLLLSMCLFATCLIWGCANVVLDVDIETTQSFDEASLGTTEGQQNDPTGTTPPAESMGTIEPTNGSDPTISTNITETTELIDRVEPEVTQSNDTTPPTIPADPTEPPTPSEIPVTVPGETKEEYVIIYEKLFGTTHSNPSTYTAETAADIILTPPTERAGYIFQGWFMGNTKMETLADCSGDITLTAKWQENSNSGGIELPDVEI